MKLQARESEITRYKRNALVNQEEAQRYGAPLFAHKKQRVVSLITDGSDAPVFVNTKDGVARFRVVCRDTLVTDKGEFSTTFKTFLSQKEEVSG